MKSGSEKRRNQRLRAASGIQGIERLSGMPITLRDFNLKAVAIESRNRILANKPVELELQHEGNSLVIHGMPIRSDRIVGRSGNATWLTAVEVRWSTPQERSQFEAFLWAVPRSSRQG